MAFIEERLLDRVTYGFTGGPTFTTTRVALFSGIVARNAEQLRPKYRFRAPYEHIQQAHHDTVVASFMATMGALHGFRFKDWADYDATTEVLGTAVGGVDETMQLVKAYDFSTTTYSRIIKKPVTGTVQLYEDTVALASTVDTETGIVTFTSTVGKVITADYEFDVPVMFDSDTMEFNFASYRTHSTDIDLVEDLAA